MHAAFKYFVYGSWWVAICAACMGLLSWFELTSNWWNAPLFVFILGSTLVVYNLNMLSGLEDLRKVGTDSERHHWCLENESLMKATLVIGLILAGGSIWWLHKVAWLLLIPLALLTLAYTTPIINTKASKIRVREIWLWKIFIIAAVWAGMTVILPAVELNGLNQFSNMLSWQLAIERGIFILAITIPFDIRDLANDAKKGVKTIPSVLGWKSSVLVSIGLLLVFVLTTFFRLGTESPMLTAYLATTAITISVVSLANPNRNDMYCSFWLEGTMLIQFASVFLLN